MVLIVVVGPGRGELPDIKGFTRLVYDWHEAICRSQNVSDTRLYVRYFRAGGTWIYVYHGVGLHLLPSEFLGLLAPYPFLPYVGRSNVRSRAIFRNRPVRVGYWFTVSWFDTSRWTFFRSYEAIEYWNPWRSEDWPESDPFRRELVSVFRRLMRFPALDRFPRVRQLRFDG